MRRCWAECLGNCDKKISREHIVSANYFVEQVVRVQGLTWCKDEPREISLQSATAKILCRTHNSALSPVDAAAGHYISCIRKHVALSNFRRPFAGHRLKVERFHVDAILLERWLLKTLINLTIESPYTLGPDGAPSKPSDSLVSVAMGLERFQGYAGMHVAGYAGMDLVMDDSLTFSPLIRDDKVIVAGTFISGGMRMLLSLDPTCPPSVLVGAQGLESQWSIAPLKRPFNKLVVKNGKYVSHVLHFRWSVA